jgi:hypothetical protein
LTKGFGFDERMSLDEHVLLCKCLGLDERVGLDEKVVTDEDMSLAEA